MVLVGPSGCGKSTLLRIIARLEAVTSGSIMIGDTEVNDMAPKDRDIAMVFQNYGLYPHMTVTQNMGFALKLAKVDKAEIARRVEHAAGILNLSALLERYEYLFALFLAGNDAQPLTVGITRFLGGAEAGAEYGIIAAYAVLVIAPVILFALTANRFIVSGMTAGAVKG